MNVTRCFLVIVFAGCAAASNAAVSPPGTDVAYCDSACNVLHELQCNSWTVNCVPACQNAFSSGFIRLPSKCVSEQTTPMGVKGCGTRCEQ